MKKKIDDPQWEHLVPETNPNLLSKPD